MKTSLQYSARKIWLVGLGAFVVRLGWVLYSCRASIDSGDQLEYVLDARSVAQGNGLRGTYNPPLYPELLGKLMSLVRACGGSHLPERLVPGVVQSALAAAVVVLIGTLASRIFSGSTAMMAALFYAVSPDNIIAQGTLMSEQLLVPLYIGAFALFFWSRKVSYTQLAGCGVLIGLAILTRPAVLPIAVIAPLLLLWRDVSWSKALRLGAVLVAPIALIVGAWLAYTQQHYGHAVLTTNAGRQLCVGHNDHATRGWAGGIGCGERPGEDSYHADHRLAGEGIRWVRHHPGREVTLTGIRVYMMSVETNGSFNLYPSPGLWQMRFPRIIIWRFCNAWALASLLLLLMAMRNRIVLRNQLTKHSKRIGNQMAIWALAPLLIPLISVGAGRYRDPIIPILAIAVGWQAASVLNKVRAPQN